MEGEIGRIWHILGDAASLQCARPSIQPVTIDAPPLPLKDLPGPKTDPLGVSANENELVLRHASPVLFASNIESVVPVPGILLGPAYTRNSAKHRRLQMGQRKQ